MISWGPGGPDALEELEKKLEEEAQAKAEKEAREDR